MATVSERMKVEPDRVFEVLADGWQYTGWVVGASHVRAVEPSWPSVGARIHHSFGVWPLVLRDDTTVEVCDRPSRLVLLANGGPLGQALPKPVMDRLIIPRNRESLARLAALAEQPTTPD